MRLGDTSRLAFDIEPVFPSWERRTSNDRGPWAQLAIWVEEQNFCRNWFPTTRSVNEGVYVPLTPIASWILRCARFIAYEESARAFPTDVDLLSALESWKSSAPAASFNEDSWDDERFEWSERHFLLAGAEGSWLPNLALVKVDNDLWISAGPVRFASPGAPSFFFETGTYSIPWRDARQTLAEFVDYVGENLRESGLSQEFPWSFEDGAFERALEIGLLDHLALELGRSPSEVKTIFGVSSETDLLRELSLPPTATVRDSVAIQAIRDLDFEPGIIDVILQCEHATRSPRHGRFREKRLRILGATSNSRPEAQGYEAAGMIRRELGLDGEPLKDPEPLLTEHFDIEIADLPNLSSVHNHAVVGGHRDGFGRVVFFRSPQTQKTWSRRMEIFRGVGHLLLDASPESSAIGAGSSNRAVGPRRRRSGAFAAEILLPQEAIRRRSSGVLDAAAEPDVFESLMADYGVGAQTAAWQCWNAGLLSSREIVYELIGAYGAEVSR